MSYSSRDKPIIYKGTVVKFQEMDTSVLRFLSPFSMKCLQNGSWLAVGEVLPWIRTMELVCKKQGFYESSHALYSHAECWIHQSHRTQHE